MSLLFTLAAFILALGILVAVHEWGHYRLAVACGVKVLRFSIGFGPTVLQYKPKKQRPGQDTEFALCLLPLGGYVRMLDRRDPNIGTIASSDLPHEFTQQAAWKRFLIVAAGPLANLVLAIVLYSFIAGWGLRLPAPILAAPAPHSAAALAGIQGGETVQQAGYQRDTLKPMRSLDDVRWLATQAAIAQRPIWLQLADGRLLELPLQHIDSSGELDHAFIEQIGVGQVWLPPVLGEIVAGDAAEQAGLQSGDRVLAINGHTIQDGIQLLRQIQSGATASGAAEQLWHIQRQGQSLELRVQPRHEALSPKQPGLDGQTEGWVSKVGIGFQPPQWLTVRLGPVEALRYGWNRTVEYAGLSLRMLWRMATGQASSKNLSGSFTIADMAGKSASMGPIAFLSFLAILSVSLGVINLLPIPLPALDGGYLVHYAVEILTGKTVSEASFALLQRLGFGFIIALMLLAHWNDINRYFL